uniref:NADH-ubiquinone oxidoreductase chain 5 n=1 Tax=Phyllodiaptomus tunguidus TaxID=2690417 RepID=A0A8K1KY46_9MAXI|nr:NADH dehydrogenase subunit 5 [Phyllodiaptomus tunguidus]UDF84446.1 NADH dehydrogenase subunit 5 [Phyllodiaptomus tunguidus]
MMKFNSFASVFLAVGLMVASVMFLFLSMAFLAGSEMIFEWQASGVNSFKINFLVVVDWVSLFFVSVVSLISASVLFFSSAYMMADVFYSRFIFLVMSFVCSMWILILSPNFISILLGWDGLGVTSYLLVIYFQSEKSFSAGLITALTNRLGDAGLLCLIGATMQMGGWSFIFYSTWMDWLSEYYLLALLGVAMTKSAQMPFSAWLPAAMAAPTPVSSLVHSSTLVTAGVYLLIRMNYLLATQKFLWGLMLLGTLTMFMAGGAAMGEVDMKKIIALSTLSQLGFMFMTLGMGLPLLAFFHLVAHAYFKAMLFMCAGGIIHSMKDFQDLRVMGGSLGAIPTAFSIFSVANLSLCGMPFMTGFYSKDLILELVMMGEVSIFMMILITLATMLTVLYSIRATGLVFFSSSKIESCFSLKEADNMMILGALILLIPSIVGGMLISWSTLSFCKLIFLPYWLKLSILIIILFSVVLSFFFYGGLKKNFLFSFVEFMWFLPFMFSPTFTQKALTLGKTSFLLAESGWSFIVMPMSFFSLSIRSSNFSVSSFLGNFLNSFIFFFFILFI